jgi:hypothetical protein
MIDDLSDVAQYGLSRATAEALVRQNRITPLLDGLDEVAEKRRAACVDAIHGYLQEQDLGKLAICCRTAEYQRLPRLYLRTAVRVEKLTRAEVERYISMDRLAKVRRAMEGDPELWTIMDTRSGFRWPFLPLGSGCPQGARQFPLAIAFTHASWNTRSAEKRTSHSGSRPPRDRSNAGLAGLLRK